MSDGSTPQSNPDHDAPHEILRVLALESTGTDRFEAPSQPQARGRVFGGQVLGQSLLAAARTVEAARPPHSLHAYFLRPGDSNQPIEFVVERLRDGRSFSARQVHAIQFGRPILTMMVSFQLPASGFDHAEPMPRVPAPEELPSYRERYERLELPSETAHWMRRQVIDLRHVEEPLIGGPVAERGSQQSVWMRVAHPIPDEPALHAAVLAYISDFTLLESVVRAHGSSWAHPGLRVASIDHALWLHRPLHADDWLLYVQSSPSAQGARGLGLGRIYQRDGVLVASVAQEGMLRFPA